MGGPSSTDYQWREISPGMWCRDIDEIECFYASIAQLYSGSGRSFFHMTGHISLSVAVPESRSIIEVELKVEEALRKAWLRLRNEQPCIASQVVWSKEHSRWKKTCRTPRNGSDLSSWVDETFKKVSVRMTGNEWANSDPPAPRMPTLFVVCPPEISTYRKPRERLVRRDLVFRSPHDVVDGIGTLQMFQILISNASYAYAMQDSDPGTPPRPEGFSLSPSFREAAGATGPLTDRQQRLLAEIGALQPGDPSIETMSMPFNAGNKLPGKHQRIARELTEDQTQRLLDACKAAGVTPTHAYHAAITMVLRDLQSPGLESRRVKYAGYILRNERSGCQAPYNTTKYAVGVYHSVSGRPLVIELDVPPESATVGQEGLKTDFLRVVSEMKNFYHQVRDDVDYIALASDLFAKGIPALPNGWAEQDEPIPVPGPNQHPSVSISSMGVVDKVIEKKNGPFNVYDPWVTGEELTNGLGCFLGAFRGKLAFSAAYNEAWHGTAEVEKFLEDCEQVVWRGFQLA